MADLTVVAAEVQPGANMGYDARIAGEAVTAGQLGYIKAADGKAYLADANDTAAKAAARGIFMNSAAEGQPTRLAMAGSPVIGATASPAVGTIYVASDVAGGLTPIGEMGASEYVSLVCIGVTGNILQLILENTGIQTPA